MSDPKFRSALTMEEIEENFEDIDVFSGIMDGLREALAYSKEEAEADTGVRKKTLLEVDP